jgi:RNA-directed DNA polymerase
MLQRAYQALIKLALEPEWEAVFEPNSYGFRPGRSPHDAIEAVFNFIRLKPKFVLKADIEKCFDKINHQALLDKLYTLQPIAKLVRGWLKAGIIDQGQTLFPETGLVQGGGDFTAVDERRLARSGRGLGEGLPKESKTRCYPFCG